MEELILKMVSTHGIASVFAGIMAILAFKSIELLKGKTTSSCSEEHRKIFIETNNLLDVMKNIESKNEIRIRNVAYEIEIISKKIEELNRISEFQKLNIASLGEEIEKLTKIIKQLIYKIY